MRHTRPATFAHMTALFLPLVTSCASSLSGVGGSDTFACKAPPGTTCTSVAGVYANAVANNLPGQAQRPKAIKSASANATSTEVFARSSTVKRAPGVGSAIRSDPRILRIWLAPWEDSEGDLHDQAYVYVTVDSGKWLIEHNRAPIRRDFAPLKLREQSVQMKPTTHSASGSETTPSKSNETSPATGGNDVP
ncbi:MAG: TraV family lipoprotein [Pseudomonadota bacterium]